MKKYLAILLVTLSLSQGAVVFAQSQAKTKRASENAGGAAAAAKPAFGNFEAVTGTQLKDFLTFIASDELEGRDTPSRGLDVAALYIANHLSRWGVKPGGDNGTYFQKFPLSRSKINVATSKVELNGQTFAYGEDFLSQYAGGNAEGKLVFAGNGWLIKDKNINPYQGLDVRDKIVVVSNSLPKGITFADLKGKQGEDWASPILYAQTNGAKALIVLPTFGNLSNWQNNRRAQTEKGSIAMVGKPSFIKIPYITAGPRLAAALFQGEKAAAANLFARAWAGETIEPFEMSADKKLSVSVALNTETVSTQNVVGILEGADPVLKNEYVAVGAHYDHDGIGTPVNGDAIYNGADDDGSGTVAVMAIAEALSKGQRPKRSVIFVWHAGEEKGLFGSEYFTDHPTVPINQIVTQLNIDMIGRARTPVDSNPLNKDLTRQNEIFVIGSKKMSTELGALSESLNKSFLNLGFDYKYDDPNDPEGLFFRSDHFNYARKGVPIIFYTDGLHEDYHKPSDSVDKIDFAQMEKVTRTIFAMAWELSNRPTRPVVDKQLTPQELGN